MTKAVLKNFALVTGKYLCWSLFLIKNFKATFLKRDSITEFSCEYWQIVKITCVEQHVRTAASIRCYFDMINLKQSGFFTTYSFKILVSERKYKNNFKNRESQKNIFYNSHIYNCVIIKLKSVLFKSVLSSHSQNTGPVTRGHVKLSQMRNKAPLQL